MMIIITGTPGTGKTSVTSELKKKFDAEYISINSLLDKYDLNLGVDEKRGYKIVDTEGMIPIIDEIRENTSHKTVIFEGHLAQDYPSADKVIVLRCNPEVLRERLSKRAWSEEKVDENVSAEILGVCTSESYELYSDRVEEIETDNQSISELSDEIIKVIEGDIRYPVGNIDYLEDYFSMLTL